MTANWIMDNVLMNGAYLSYVGSVKEALEADAKDKGALLEHIQNTILYGEELRDRFIDKTPGPEETRQVLDNFNSLFSSLKGKLVRLEGEINKANKIVENVEYIAEVEDMEKLVKSVVSKAQGNKHIGMDCLEPNVARLTQIIVAEGKRIPGVKITERAKITSGEER